MITKVDMDCGRVLDTDRRPVDVTLTISFNRPSKEELKIIETLVDSCLSELKSLEDGIGRLLVKEEKDEIDWPKNEVIREDQLDQVVPLTSYEDSVRAVGRRLNSPHENEVSDQLDAAIGVEPPHPYFCVQHGGSLKGEESNKRNGFTCPRCSYWKRGSIKGGSAK